MTDVYDGKLYTALWNMSALYIEKPIEAPIGALRWSPIDYVTMWSTGCHYC